MKNGYICGMKRFLPFCILLFLASACQRKEISQDFRWTSIDRVSDSLILRLESDYAAGKSDSALLSLSARLEDVASKDGSTSQLKARAHFWNARIANRMHDRPKAVGEIQSALKLSDSSAYPYDHARFLHLDAIMRINSTPYVYHILKTVEAFHTSNHDNVMKAHTFLDLGNILHDLGDTRRALMYYMAADSIYNLLDLKEFHIKTKLNNASIMHSLGEKDKASRLIKYLLADSTARADADFYTTVEYMGSFILGEPELLEKAYARVAHTPSMHGRYSLYASGMAEKCLKQHKNDSAAYYNRVALENLRPVQYASNTLLTLKTAATIYDALGMYDSVAEMSKRYFALSDSVEYSSTVNAVYAEENRSEIEKYEELIESKRTTERLLFWVVILGVAILAMIILFALMKHRDRHRIEMAKAQLEVEKERRQLVTTSLVMTEKDNVLQSVLNDVERMKSESIIPASEAKQIENTIKLHFSNKADHEAVSMLFEKVQPSFSRHLKERYPRLSEGDIKLSIYIKAGMTTKQIAKMLMLLPDSVKKNRHRLRERLELDPSTSLEDFLRHFD